MRTKQLMNDQRMQRIVSYILSSQRCWMIVLSFIIGHLSLSHAVAQEFGMRWLYSPQADETQQIWFKRSIHMGELTKKAVLSIASEGRYIVYVNGYNISSDLFSSNPRGVIGIRDYSIENYLTEGTNTIAVWYSPVNYSHRQLYAVLSGQWQSGGSFYIGNDKGWTCHVANARTLPDGSEEIDGSRYQSNWKEFDIKENSFMLSEWKPAVVASDLEPAIVTFSHHECYGYHAVRILKRAKVSQNGRTLTYDFGQQFDGWVRVTMRGMKKGDVIQVNGLRYVCKGGSDDQACRRFTIGTAGMAHITLPAGRSRSNITTVEAISITDNPNYKP